MKTKMLISVLIITLFTGCINSSDNNAIESTKIESPKPKTEIKVPTKKFQKDEESKVYGELRFGSSLKDFKSLFPNKVNTIMNIEFEFDPYFDENKSLYGLRLKGVEKQEFPINVPLQQMTALIMKQYGEPSETIFDKPSMVGEYDNSELTFYSFEEDNLTRIWRIGSKKIVATNSAVIKKGASRYYHYYYPTVTIIDTTLAAKVYKQQADASEEELINESSRF